MAQLAGGRFRAQAYRHWLCAGRQLARYPDALAANPVAGASAASATARRWLVELLDRMGVIDPSEHATAAAGAGADPHAADH